MEQDLFDLEQWQIAHIQKRLEAAERGEFATEEEVEAFFSQYGLPDPQD